MALNVLRIPKGDSMKKHILRTAALGCTLSSAIFAQDFQRQATMVGGGAPDRGRCTVEVVVDDVAQIEIRGDRANVKTLAGAPAQFRRFECTAPIPANPGDFRFNGISGRGHQAMIRDPRNGGEAVIQIEDKQSGAGTYAFQLEWQGRGGYPGGGVSAAPPPDNRDRRDGDRRDGDRREFGMDDAARMCQDAINQQATRRFGNAEVHFGRIGPDPDGDRGRLNGSVDIRRGPREERYRFSCAVDFNDRRLRSAQLDDRPMDQDRDRDRR